MIFREFIQRAVNVVGKPLVTIDYLVVAFLGLKCLEGAVFGRVWGL